jgi:hypothetical protein
MRILFAAALLCSAACALSQEDYGKLAEQARVCQPQDTCVLGPNPCLCGVPVNSRDLAKLQDAAKGLHCTSLADCIPPADRFACINGRCEGLWPDGGLWP